MATTCDTVDLIQPTENIGASLTKINTNFNTLKNIACDIENLLQNTVNVRTFFYYGPNSATSSSSGVDDNIASYPSNSLIQNFVNADLSLPAISEDNDIAYVIYQKTGWTTNNILTQRSGSGKVPYSRTVQVPQYRRIGINWGKGLTVFTGYANVTQTFYAPYNWSININDQYINYAPVYILYKLVQQNSVYVVQNNFPKFIRATTASSINWNNPMTWSIY